MKSNPLQFDFIGTSHDLSDEMRRKVTARVMLTRGAKRRFFLATFISTAVFSVLIIPVYGALFPLIYGAAARGSNLSLAVPVIVGVVPILLMVTLMGTIHTRIARKMMAPYAKQALQAFGLEECRKCGYSLRGLSDDVACCPECGADRQQLKCYTCGYEMRSLSSENDRCPECGTMQRTVGDAPRSWWIVFQHVDPVIELIARPRLRLLRREALSASIGRILIILSLMACVIAGLSVLYLDLVLESTLVQVALMQLGVFAFPAAAWLVRVTYGAQVRRAARGLGYDVCLKCGWWFRDRATALDACPHCGTERSRAEPAAQIPTLPSADEMREVALAYEQVRWQFAAAMTKRFTLIGLGLGALIGGAMLIGFFVLKLGWLSVLLALCLGAPVSMAIRESQRRDLRRRVLRELNTRGHRVCSGCGGWLRGLGDDGKQCPECGAKREVTIAPSAS